MKLFKFIKSNVCNEASKKSSPSQQSISKYDFIKKCGEATYRINMKSSKEFYEKADLTYKSSDNLYNVFSYFMLWYLKDTLSEDWALAILKEEVFCRYSQDKEAELTPAIFDLYYSSFLSVIKEIDNIFNAIPTKEPDVAYNDLAQYVLNDISDKNLINLANYIRSRAVDNTVTFANAYNDLRSLLK